MWFGLRLWEDNYVTMMHGQQNINSPIYYLRGVSKKFGEWYQKTKETEDTNTHRTSLIWRPQAPDQGIKVEFFLFPRLKSIMKGARFADVASIQERLTAVLRSILKEAFADTFQKLYKRFKQCFVKDDDYFEGQ
jgi:hypothetical protein